MGWTIRGSNPGGVEVFRTCPDRPWGPPRLMRNGHWVFSGVRRSGRGSDHPLPSKCRRHERVELYLYSPTGPSWPVIGRTLPLPFIGTSISSLSYCYICLRFFIFDVFMFVVSYWTYGSALCLQLALSVVSAY